MELQFLDQVPEEALEAVVVQGEQVQGGQERLIKWIKQSF